MANLASQVKYIRYAFPSQSGESAAPAPSSGLTSEPIQHQTAESASTETDLLDLGPQSTATSFGATVPAPSGSQRVLDWISHNTGESGGSLGDWQTAGQISNRSRRRAHRARVHQTQTNTSVARDAQQNPASTADSETRQPSQREFAIRKYVEETRAPAEPGSWQACAEVPSTNEVMYQSPDSTVPRNQVEGAWQSKDEYLEAHYRLIREDTVFPLRAAVHQIRENPTAQEEYFNGSIGIYDRVYIVGFTTDIRGAALRIAFSLNRVGKRVKWEQSKRLISGSMVALTPTNDMFQDKTKCVIATVAARGLANVQLNPPEIDLYIPRASELEIDPAIEWVMVEERSAYFEASRHVLTALQKLSREPFPMQEHLVEVEKKVDMPSYIKNHPVLDLSTAFVSEDKSYTNIDVVQDWPKKPETSLDSSQLLALRRILSKKLSIIQGPPGTGKTHVSVVALRVMLANLQPGDPPIIVSCQTNHALDQLLRHVAQFEKQFARLGGRSKDRGVVKERTLYQLRLASKKHPGAGALKATSMVRMRAVESRIGKLLEPLATGSTHLLNPQLYKNLGLLTDAQCRSLEEGDQDWIQHDVSGCADEPIQQWLGTQLQIVTRHVHPDDCAYDYEDADLESEVVLDLEAEANLADDDFTDGLHGAFFPIRDNFTGKSLASFSDVEIEAALRKNQSLYGIKPKQRGSVYAYLQRQVKLRLLKALRDESQKYNDLAVERRTGAWERDLEILKEQKLIGVTTTGLSKYRPLISALKPRIVLVEEAAEAIEAPVAVACVPSLEHLILVGDHQQLRPQCSVKYFEGSPFNLNVSLFERMVLNEMEYEVIKRQRRMIPEVRRLLEPIYGKGTIKDHPLVKSEEHRPSVPGMGGVNSFFFTHEWPETRDENLSACNIQEAEMLVAFFDYLVLNGIPAQSITVMTFYNGQRKAIGKAFRKHPNLRGSFYNIVTVDSYQGEQNDVILLSLTRSNENYNIGFLSVVNRICVALSRAKRGFYLFGNAETLCAESGIWADVVSIMMGRTGEICPDPVKRIGFYMPLKCETHGRAILAEEIDDLRSINGGCTLPCDGTLPCGHPCGLRCHPFAHEEVICIKPCQRLADCGHACTAQCCEACRCGICKDEDELDPAESIGLSLRQIDASGAAMPISYGLSGTTAASSRQLRAGRSSSPSAWKDYATNGVDAHDRKLRADPLRTFNEWDGSTALSSGQGTSPSVHKRESHVTPARVELPLHGVRALTMDDVGQPAYQNRVVKVVENVDKRYAGQVPAVADEPQRRGSVDLIDFD